MKALLNFQKWDELVGVHHQGSIIWTNNPNLSSPASYSLRRRAALKTVHFLNEGLDPFIRLFELTRMDLGIVASSDAVRALFSTAVATGNALFCCISFTHVRSHEELGARPPTALLPS